MSYYANDFKIKSGVLTRYCGDTEEVIVPEGVTEIYARAFMDKNMRSLSLPRSLKRIGRLAFARCDKLEKAVIPNGVESMKDGTFSGCAALKEVRLPANLKTLPPMTFYHCQSLSRIDLPETLTEIGGGAFCACYRLTEINVPEGVEEIGANAFARCFDLRKVRLPESLKELGACAFESCGITEINVPKQVTRLRFNTFENCRNLNKVVLSEGLCRIEQSAFEDCVSLETVNLPDSMEYVDLAFENTALTNNSKSEALYLNGHLISVKPSVCGEFTVRDGTKSISAFAFNKCGELTAVRIPNSVAVVGSCAFSRCASSLTVYADFDCEPKTWSGGLNPEKCRVVWTKSLL